MTEFKSVFQIKQIKTKRANTTNMLKNVSANYNTCTKNKQDLPKVEVYFWFYDQLDSRR